MPSFPELTQESRFFAVHVTNRQCCATCLLEGLCDEAFMQHVPLTEFGTMLVFCPTQTSFRSDENLTAKVGSMTYAFESPSFFFCDFSFYQFRLVFSLLTLVFWLPAPRKSVA